MEIADINKDYQCVCFGKPILNISPQTGIHLFLTVLVITFCFGFIANDRSTTTVFLPVITGLIGFWLPSPSSSSSNSRSQAVQHAQLLLASQRQ